MVAAGFNWDAAGFEFILAMIGLIITSRDKLDIDFENLSKDDCRKISFLEIEIQEINIDYKPYLENYFSALGNNKTNFFTDISNYISYELLRSSANNLSINTKL